MRGWRSPSFALAKRLRIAGSDRAPVDDVFINCPFDERYAPTLRALIFATYACGFRPRSAREADDAGETRTEKLFGLIEACRYGIHDLSRTEADDVHGLPRFNMPLELGIFLGARRYGEPSQRLKRTLIFDVEPYRYQRFVSELAGMDIHAHGGTLSRLCWKPATGWRPFRVERLYKVFVVELPVLARSLEFDPDRISYVDYERFAVEWLL